SLTKRKWVYKPYFKKLKSRMLDYSTISTQNIEKHLFKEHKLINRTGKRLPALRKGMKEKTPLRNIIEILNLNTLDPKE
ncbi:hypothetical protein EDB81DRAFT_643576, partial [Dactylonectria macrodidyma]